MSAPACPCDPAAAAPQSFLDCLTYFLTAQVWKQAQAAARHRRAVRWQTQPLLLVLLVMTWCAGDSLPERFETARAFYVACHQRRRRPGKTFAGFEKALGKVPLPVLRAVAAAVRQRLAQVFAERFRVDGWIPLGCDGSRLACPRSQELEQRLGLGAKKRRRKKKAASASPLGPKPEPDPGLAENQKKAEAGPDSPQIWVTAVVHLGLGVLWSWRLGKGTASERAHLRQLVVTLPRGALLVADAGYVGYALLAALQAAGLFFLVRLSSRAPLYVPDKSTLRHYCEGQVYYWPQKVQKLDLPPIPVRLLRIRGDRVDVWLITNVLDKHRLPRKTAGKFYRWRWRNEGLFRTYKRTLGKVKLMSRTVAQVHREAEGSLLATQLLLAQGALALQTTAAARIGLPSARKVLLEIRAEIRDITGMYLGPRQRQTYLHRLAQARWRDRCQLSARVRRRWPGRKDHQPPGRPQILKMGTILKDKMAKTLAMAQVQTC
ncbi:MAG TPA: transposase [Gemmataceae bacterium]|nr:transposase [Gemmataceae bacterium]